MRQLIEKISRGKILKRRLPRQFGYRPLYVSPDSQLKYLKIFGDIFDKELLFIVSKYINEFSSVWDVGANVGVFSYAAAHIAKKGCVLAIEADIWLANLMRKSLCLRRNKDLNLKILPIAVADTCGISEFLISDRGRACNALEFSDNKRQSFVARERSIVPTFSLDMLLSYFKEPDFVKIDVEGAEELVLKGAASVLTKIRPIIYIEVGEEVAESVTRVLHLFDYMLFNKLGGALSKCSFNTVAIPKEKL